MDDTSNCNDYSSDDENYSPPPGLSMDTSLELFPGLSVVLPEEKKDDATSKLKTDGKSDGRAAKKSAETNFHRQTMKNEHRTGTDSFSDAESLKEQEIHDVTLNEKNVCIQGTNIVLDSPDDIKAWIFERKKNWPTAKRIAQKKKFKSEEEKILQHYNGTDESKGRNRRPHLRICKFWKKTGHCRNGKRCKFLHQNGSSVKRLPNNSIKLIHGIPVQIPHRFSPPVNCGKSLASLLAEGEHIKNENVKLLDLFERLVKSGAVSTDWKSLKKRLHLDSKADTSLNRS